MVIFMLLLIPLEFIIRLCVPFHVADSTEIYRYDEITGYSLKPNFSMMKLSDYLQEYHFNNIGTANLEDIDLKDSCFVFTVGDSYTFGCGNSVEESYPTVLDLMLRDSIMLYDNNMVVNLGVNGFGGKQNLLRLKSYVKKLKKPKFILYLGCDNDYSDDLLFDSGYRHKHLVEGSPYWGGYYKPTKFLFQDLHIGRYIKSAIGNLRRKSIVVEGKEKGVCVAALEEAVLNELHIYCKENDINLVMSWVVSQNEDSYLWTKKWSESNNIAFADWLPDVQKKSQQISTIEMFNKHSGGHYKTWVNYDIAKAYINEINKITLEQKN
jgi:hypothetical protein